MKLTILNGTFQLLKLPPSSPIPSSVSNAEWYNICKTDDELSIIISDEVYVESKFKECGWKIIKFVESMDLNLVGITAKITNVLADNKINLCALATYNTDWILVKVDKIDKAVGVLEKNGYKFV